MSGIKLASLDEALRELDAFEKSGLKPEASWPLQHCAQSIELSMTAFPAMKPKLFQATVGKLVKNRFLSKGEMSHDLTAPVPGASTLDASVAPERALETLRGAIRKFQAHQGGLAPHFAYGPVTKPEFDALHAMHIANHLNALR